MEPKITVTNNNIHIEDSYQYQTSTEMQDILNAVIVQYPTYDICLNRSISSMIREWRAHNCLYWLHLWRSHTKDVDLNYPQKWYMRIVYYIISLFYGLKVL